MFECFIMHNGASDLPPAMVNGVMVCDGTPEELQEASRRTLINQIRQGVLADRLGFSGFCMTEHHFSIEGIGLTPNPILAEVAIAAHTNRIRLVQIANIITEHEPIRLAEQAAMLDVISGGRLEFGLGRGYQSREVETFGSVLGSSLMDDERNRVWFDEARELILKAWTQETFSDHGDNWSIPPKHVIWNHKQTIAYYESGKSSRTVDDMFSFGGPTRIPLPVYASQTHPKELTLFPQPVQKPYPPLWLVATSERSIRAAAQAGANTVFESPTASSKLNVAMYYDECERQGWPDRLQPGKPLKYGWDSERRRGVLCNRFIHIADKGVGDMARAARALELQWDYFGPFGFSAGLAMPGEKIPHDLKVNADYLRHDRKMALHGSVDEIIEELLRLKTDIGYEDDYAVMCWFELGGFSGTEIEEQMQCFAENVMPVLERECGGRPELPLSHVSLQPTVTGAPTVAA